MASQKHVQKISKFIQNNPYIVILLFLASLISLAIDVPDFIEHYILIKIPSTVAFIFVLIILIGFLVKSILIVWQHDTYQLRKRRSLKQHGTPPWLYVLAKIIIVIVPMLIISSTFAFIAWVTTESKYTVVLVADFLDPTSVDTNRITRTLIERMKETFRDHPDIIIESLGESINNQNGDGSEAAREIGALPEHKASIVIWGDYVIEPEPELYMHYEILHETASSTEILGLSKYEKYGPTQIQPNMFEFKIKIADHLSQIIAFTSSLVLIDAERFNEAASLLEASMASSKEPLDIHLSRNIRLLYGGCLAILAQTQKAIDEFSYLISQDIINVQDEITFYAYLSRGRLFKDQGSYNTAIEDYNHAIQLRPDFSDAHIYRGVAYLEYGNYSEAILSFAEAIKIDSKSGDGYYFRGMAHIGMKDYEAAVNDFNTVIQLSPSSSIAYSGRALAYEGFPDFVAALEDHKTAIQLSSDSNFMLYVNRANTYLSMGDIESALKDYNLALQLSPNNAAIYVARGRAYFHAGNFSASHRDLTEAIKLKPQDPRGYIERGRVLSQQKLYNLSIADFTQAIVLDPKNTSAFASRAFDYIEQGKLDQAVSDFTNLINLDPGNFDAYISRATIYQEKGALGRALQDYNNAIAINPNSALVYNNRGSLYADQGELDKAINDFTKAVTLNPVFAGAIYNRSLAYKKQGKLKEAEKDYLLSRLMDPNVANSGRMKTYPYDSELPSISSSLMLSTTLKTPIP